MPTPTNPRRVAPAPPTPVDLPGPRPDHLARRLRLTAVAVALAAAAALPAGARAATVTRSGDGTLTYTAAPGAVNNSLSVQVGYDGPAVTALNASTDDDVTAIPGDCQATRAYGSVTVSCPTPPRVVADLGDGDDIAHVSFDVTVPVTVLGGAGDDLLEGNAAPQTLDGGPGDDRLSASGGDDVVLGGDGQDQLQGGGGDDRLDGGAGDDLLRPDGFEAPGRDVVDGGPGVDRLEQDYSARTTSVHPPIVLTLAGGADDGRPGEGDDVHGVESVTLGVAGDYAGTEGPDQIVLQQVGAASRLAGGGGDDRLRGGDGADAVDGGAGDDVLDGGYGDDRIVGGPGRDVLAGDSMGAECGPSFCKLPYGNDLVEARDGEVDSITCGAGADRVIADAIDVVAPDCETVERPAGPVPGAGGGSGPGAGGVVAGGPPAPVALRVIGSHRLADVLRRGLRVQLSGARSRTRVRALLGGRVVAEGTGVGTVTLRLTGLGRRRLRGASHATLRLVAGAARGTVTLTGARASRRGG